jgi:hypothetical protein
MDPRENIIAKHQRLWAESEKRWRERKRKERLAARGITGRDFPSLRDQKREER